MGRGRDIQRRRWGFVIGGAVTALGVAASDVGVFDRLDDYWLDLEVRHLSTIEADPRIVLVDINDHALRAIGDWPWPRRRYAQLVKTLDELGADRIVLDLVLSEPASPRTRHAGLGPHYDVDAALAEVGDRAEDAVIYDDDELRDAMIEAGNVYLAMFFRLRPPDVARRGIGEGEQGPLRSRIIALLEEDFTLDAAALADKLGTDSAVDLQTIESQLPRVKRLVARRAAKRFFADRPDGAFPDFLALMLPHGDVQAVTPDREDLIQAYRAQNAFRALARFSPVVSAALLKCVPAGYDLTLPVDKFARAARGIGFVSFEREKSGGVVREIPLLANADGLVVSQLGLLVATDVLGIDRSSIGYNGMQLVLGSGTRQRRLPVSKDGRTLLNWNVPAGSARWQDSFEHIPVTRVLEIPLNAEAMADNDRRLRLATARLVELRHADTHAEYAEYVRLINRRRALQEGESATGSDESSRLDARIGRIEEDAIVWLRRVHGLWEKTEPVDDIERAQLEKINGLYSELGEGQLASRLRAINDALASRNAALRKELRPRIEGRICLVGYTASGVADLVTSPVYEAMPGVMAHANVINMVLQDRPATRGPVWLSMLILLASGIVITVVTSLRGPVLSGGCLLVVVGLIVAAGGIVFWSSTYHVASIPAGIQSCIVWASVTVYRQFTEERARRQFQRALSQYTSPAVAARIAGRASALDLAPRHARVTCFFSDLQGFTPLSERLGAERTRLVLNPYFRVMSRVLVEHHAVINKFMGDGIFAFFNAPIWPCANHSEAACDCALASLAALRELNRQEPILRGLEPLTMRIGISTGDVFVGDYGSDTKLDYTCIGDTVNLAARLEEANKTLGTTILVNDTCRSGAGRRFSFRSLGSVEVAGKSRPVEVHELIGWTVPASERA